MPARSARRTLLVFAKAPVPGGVKTRLASELGREGAAKLYRTMGRRTVDRVRPGDHRTVVYFDPPDSEVVVREWLGEDRDLEYLPQPEGDLGVRLRHAFDWGFEQGDLVCVIGTDIPALGRAEVEEAFSRMSGADPVDAVFGPALDGGYYLLGLRHRAPDLFEAIAWSTPAVMDQSLARAARLGMRVALLRPLADVDRPGDLTDELRSALEARDPRTGS